MLQEVSGLMDTRTNGYWDYWMLGLLDTRTIGYSDYWILGLLDIGILNIGLLGI